MHRPWIAALLLALLALQAVAKVADAHQLHQDGSHHLSFDHKHEAAKPSSVDVKLKFDCHHCCHCHSHFSPVLPSNNAPLQVTDARAVISPYQFNLCQLNSAPLLRPPIA